MKCIPIIFGIDFNKIPMLFGSFYKFAYYAYRNKWPIIAQEQYFLSPEIYNEKFLDEVFEINEIERFSEKLLNEVDSYIINKDETNNIINEFGSKENAWINLMNKKSHFLYQVLNKYIKVILKKYNDIKAIVVWRHNYTICLLAKKYNLKVIEMELSAIRKKTYNFGLSYFQFSNKYSKEELNKRYERFNKELKTYKENLPVLTRKEILNLILKKDMFKSLENEEMYDFGIALGLRSDFETISSNSITNEDMIKDILRIEKGKNVLIRKHPLDANYKYENEEDFNIDHSNSSVDFIMKCHKVVSSVSNINFEAMILGKTCYTLGNMPFSRFSYENLNYNDEYVINLYDLNFLIFCYYVPYSLCLDQDYINFRLSNQSEIDIYLKHYNYIISKYKKENSYDFDRITIRSKYLFRKHELDLYHDKVNKLNDENKTIMDFNLKLKNELKKVIDSRSWKLTKPLRNILFYIKKINRRF